jgi:hypothetical protein
VNDTQTFLKRHAAFQRCHHHFPARVAIRAVIRGATYKSQARDAPSSAMASAGGLINGQRYVSMQWVRASMPVAAVNNGSNFSVSSGSHIALVGIRCGLINASFEPFVRFSKAPRPTLLPELKKGCC